MYYDDYSIQHIKDGKLHLIYSRGAFDYISSQRIMNGDCSGCKQVVLLHRLDSNRKNDRINLPSEKL